ncbi:MAG: uridylate kinase [Chloroflexi bacterium]|nr:uridylate kinase [Chloroflexota bacterium]
MVGHGSGSFGHSAAPPHGTMGGVRTAAQWRGFAEVATVARRLNQIVLDAWLEAGVPVLGVSPSASARCSDGSLEAMDHTVLETAVANGLIGVTHGDVAFDVVRGGTIVSTEAVFVYLAKRLNPDRILLAGDYPGVIDADGTVIEAIHPENRGQYAAALGGSGAVDVTGGMAAKVDTMLDLCAAQPGLRVRIFSGRQAGRINAALTDESFSEGTEIYA